MESTAEIASRVRAGAPVGIAEVARRARVSIATVSRVLNGVAHKASAETVQRVSQAARELGYRPAHAGRALRTNQTRLVALLIPDLTNTFYAAVARSIETSLAQQDHAMILCNTDEDPAAQDRYLAEMLAHRVRGIALLGAVTTPGLERAVQSQTPVVFVNRKPPGGRGIFVGIDNYAAGQAVGRHLLGSGYGDCAAIHGPLWSTASRARFEGYRDALKAGGLDLTRSRMLETALTMEGGFRAAKRMLSRPPRPRAIFCGNDQIAYGVFRCCRELSLRVPDDIALFGFDDNPLNDWLAPWLSTVHVPHQDFGPAVLRAFKLLWETGDGTRSRDIFLDYAIVLRGSA